MRDTKWNFGVTLFAGLFAACMGPAQAQAADLGRLEAGAPLVLPLEGALLANGFAVEIDGIDLTEFATVGDAGLQVALPAQLAGELHDVTVYSVENGAYVVLASFSFSTARSQRLSLSVDAYHEATVQQLNDSVSGGATSSGTIAVENEDGSFRAQASYLATSREGEEINGNPVDLAEYLLELDRNVGPARVVGRVGHQALDYDAALVGDVYRRGISLDLGLLDQRLELGAFSAQSADVLGARNLLGVANRDSRMSGARIAFTPFSQQDLRFSLQGYSGRGDPYGGEVTGQGEGASFAFDGSLADGRLRFGSAWSRTYWDEDAGGPLPEGRGEGMLSYLSYDALPETSDGRALTIGLAHEKVDANYFSLANPGVATGVETWRLTMDYRANRFGLNLLADTQETNVGGPSDWPTDRISQVGLDGSYDFQGEGFWQGAALRFGASYLQQTRLETPNMAPPPEDYSATTLYLGFDKYGDAGGWSLDYALIDENDKTALNADTISHTFTAGFDRSFNSRTNLNGQVSYTRFIGAMDRWDLYDASVGLDYVIREDKLNLHVNAGITRTNEPFAQDGERIAAELSWRFAPAAELVLSASRANGAYASDYVNGGDTLIALSLRATTNFLR